MIGRMSFALSTNSWVPQTRETLIGQVSRSIAPTWHPLRGASTLPAPSSERRASEGAGASNMEPMRIECGLRLRRQGACR